MKDFSQEVFQQIDNYLLGNMPPVDATQFETKMASDAGLQQEVNFQKDLVQQINNNEALRIKAHLNTIPVSSTSPFLQSKWLFTYAAAGIVAIGVSVYTAYVQFDNNPNTIATTHSINNEFKDFYSGESNTNVSNVDVEHMGANNNNNNNSDDVNMNPAIAGNIGNNVNVPAANNEDGNNNGSNASNQDNVIAPMVGVNDLGEDGVEVDDQNPKDIAANNTDAAESKIGPYSIKPSKGSGKLKYYFENDKLYLLNIKDDMIPYKMYDVPTKAGRGKEYFIKLKDKFYKLDQTQTDKTAMEEITNTDLIDKLNSLRTK